MDLPNERHFRERRRYPYRGHTIQELPSTTCSVLMSASEKGELPQFKGSLPESMQ
jgi:hypothetical protein